MPRHNSRAATLPGAVWTALILGAVAGCAIAAPASADQTAWEQWQHLVGIVDLGVRSDGSLVGMAAGRLYLVSPSGTIAPFAAGADGFKAGSPDAESYFVVAPTPALAVDNAGCTFNGDDVFILDLGQPLGLVRVDPAGRSSRFASLSGVEFLSGITIDTTGKFGNRLLITATRQNNTVVFAVDCLGVSTLITDSGPPMEGGIAVAPATFGQFAGALIGPDEHTGQVWAIDATGQATVVAVPNLPSGPDIGVESAGFVPPGFFNGGFAYLADRGTPNNPFPGTDSILRLSAAALASAGVQEGDLLVSTEANGTTVAIHCEATCWVIQVAEGPKGGHIEGKVLLVADQPAAL